MSPDPLACAPETGSAARIRAQDIVYVLLVIAAFVVLMRALVSGLPKNVESVLALLALQSMVPIATVYLLIVRRRGVDWADLGLRPVARRWYRHAVVIALATVPVVGAVNALTQALVDVPFTNPQLKVLAPAGFSWIGLIGMLAMAGVVAPVVEEIVFRGLLYGWLRRRVGVALGIALSALLFAFAHGIVILAPALAVQGVILATVYQRSGSLWPSIVVHGTFNAIMTSVLYAALAAGVILE